MEQKRKASVANYKSFLYGLGKGLEDSGDVIAMGGYVVAPFTEGASLSVSAFGEGISTLGKVISNSARFAENGATTENIVDLGVDILAELAPLPQFGVGCTYAIATEQE